MYLAKNIFKLRLFKCEDLLFSSALYHCKLKIIGLWTVAYFVTSNLKTTPLELASRNLDGGYFKKKIHIDSSCQHDA